MDIKDIAEKHYQHLKAFVSFFKQQTGQTPTLHVLLVGNHSASLTYVHHKKKAAHRLGMSCKIHDFEVSVSQSTLEVFLKKLNRQRDCHGIIIQLPLPRTLDTNLLLEGLPPIKDVDGLHPYNRGLLFSPSGHPFFVACTPWGCIKILKELTLDLQGARVVVMGRSALVGRPLLALLMRENATVTLIHGSSTDIPEIAKTADILCVAVGNPGLIDASYVKKGAVVLDVGIHHNGGMLCGDVDYQSVMQKASFCTPVPGGVGVMTVCGLMHNTLRAAYLQNALEIPAALKAF